MDTIKLRKRLAKDISKRLRRAGMKKVKRKAVQQRIDQTISYLLDGLDHDRSVRDIQTRIDRVPQDTHASGRASSPGRGSPVYRENAKVQDREDPKFIEDS